jgi:adenylate cyclase
MTSAPAHREIERKFLVAGDGWRAQVVGEPVVMRAGYLSRRPGATIRVRFEGARAVLTLKGQAVDPEGRERPEFNIDIDAGQAEAMLAGGMVDGGIIHKTRHEVRVGASLFVVDVFSHPRAGLVLAEIELPHRDADFERPDWLGEEVTADSTYSNAVIAGEA